MAAIPLNTCATQSQMDDVNSIFYKFQVTLTIVVSISTVILTYFAVTILIKRNVYSTGTKKIFFLAMVFSVCHNIIVMLFRVADLVKVTTAADPCEVLYKTSDCRHFSHFWVFSFTGMILTVTFLLLDFLKTDFKLGTSTVIVCAIFITLVSIFGTWPLVEAKGPEEQLQSCMHFASYNHNDVAIQSSLTLVLCTFNFFSCASLLTISARRRKITALQYNMKETYKAFESLTTCQAIFVISTFQQIFMMLTAFEPNLNHYLLGIVSESTGFVIHHTLFSFHYAALSLPLTIVVMSGWVKKQRMTKIEMVRSFKIQDQLGYISDSWK